MFLIILNIFWRGQQCVKKWNKKNPITSALTLARFRRWRKHELQLLKTSNSPVRPKVSNAFFEHGYIFQPSLWPRISVVWDEGEMFLFLSWRKRMNRHFSVRQAEREFSNDLQKRVRRQEETLNRCLH
jgi:hypothetical protein